MKIKAIPLLFILLFLMFNKSFSQEDLKKWELNGYVSQMSSYFKFNSNLLGFEYLDNTVHNRLNLHWYQSDKFTASLQLRNQLLVGDQIRHDTLDALKDHLDKDFLAFNLIEDRMAVLNSMIDRLYFKYSRPKLDITLGRQRINWGQTYVFNSNDIFNAYSFFEFDYPERPGSDALRIQFYPGYTSTVEAAIKYKNDTSITAAALGRFSKWNYDIQMIGGLYNSDDLVIGGGWAGNIKDVSFSGEFSYLHPYKEFKDTSGLFFASINLNYLFSNSLMIQFETFYNQYLKNKKLTFGDLLGGEQDIKSLTVSEFTLFASLSYPFNPLINSSMSIMYYLDVKGINIFPSFDFSISNKASFSIIGMYFKGEFDYGPPFGIQDNELYLAFLRFKYSF